jgi:hypothetical protein
MLSNAALSSTDWNRSAKRMHSSANRLNLSESSFGIRATPLSERLAWWLNTKLEPGVPAPRAQLMEPLIVSEPYGRQNVSPVGGYLNASGAGSHMGPEECRRSGAECLRLAQLVTNRSDKMLLLHLADAWRRLAERAAFQPADQDDCPPPMLEGNRLP